MSKTILLLSLTLILNYWRPIVGERISHTTAAALLFVVYTLLWSIYKTILYPHLFSPLRHLPQLKVAFKYQKME